MRRFFYDTEFMEEPGFLQLISIGVVDESGEMMFHAANLDADLSRANEWVKANVIPKLPRKGLRCFYGKSPAWMKSGEISKNLLFFLSPSKDDPVELWGNYSAYDHVLLCWLFGRMVDLPNGMPMYTMDIQQYVEFLGVDKSELPPEGSSVHDALCDAKWNRAAWLYLNGRERHHGR